MADLIDMKSIPVRKGDPMVTEEEISAYSLQVPDWKVIAVAGENRMQRVYKFKDFIAALEFTNQVGALAEEQDHHPALLTEWGKVTVTWWTHVINGLHQNDFVSAAKTDQIYSPD